MSVTDDTPATTTGPTMTRGVFRDVMGCEREFEHPESTFIDPDVIIDEPSRVSIGEHCIIRSGVVLRPETGRIVIGDHCTINHYTVIHAKGGVYIGDWTIIAPHCGVYAQNHSCDSFDRPITLQSNIGHGVYLMGDNWLGSHAVVCDDVTLGKGAVLGANSTATRSIPTACVAAGTPARIIRKRCDDSQDSGSVASNVPPEVSRNAHINAQRAARLLNSNDRVLEIGCGKGVNASALASRCRSFVGCDYSLEAIETARNAAPNVEFAYSNATRLRFPDQTFDVVVMSHPVEHLLPTQLDRSLDEACRVLTANGRLIVATLLTDAGDRASGYRRIHDYSTEQLHDLLGRRFAHADFIDKKFGVFFAERPTRRRG